jgi:hypothetical protein
MPRPLVAALQIREAHPAWPECIAGNAPAACSGTGIPRSASRMAGVQRRQTKDQGLRRRRNDDFFLFKSKIQNPKSRIINHSFFSSNASPQPSGEKSARPAVTPYRVGTD